MLNSHPGLPDFDYIRLNSLKDTSQFLADNYGTARPLCGGTDIFVRMRDGFWDDKYLVEIKHLDGMGDLNYDPSSGLVIGAAVNMNQVIKSPKVINHYPLLSEAAYSVASYQLRNRATIAGNICNASPAGDTIGACLLLGGILNIYGIDGYRQLSLKDFFLGPGQTALNAGEVVVSIQFPPPPEGLAGKYIKLGRNKLSDLAIVGVTALGFPNNMVTSGYTFKLALASVAPVPLIVQDVETILSEGIITNKRISDAAQAAMDACSPIDDVRGSARYRKHMVKNLSNRALTEVWIDLIKEV